MSLPSGYRRLEYIQSSGTQYIDTGFKPNQNTKMILKMAMLADLTSKNATGVRNSSSDATNRFGIVVYTAQGKFGGFFGTNGISGATADTNVHVHEVGPDGYIVDGVSYGTMSSTTFSVSYNLPLLSWSNGSNGNEPITGRLYSCQLYYGETLVRDFVPCKNSSGVIGLYDLVNAVFYQNAGTGMFTAGPEALEVPHMPDRFVASFLAETTVQLSWSVSENATGYKLYKNGILLSTLTDTSYTDTVQVFSGTLYAVTAYNDDGESTAAELTYCSIPENPILYLVTDRTESDASYAKLLSGKGLGGMSDAEKAEWLSGLKGSYNAPDLNRVGSAVDYVAGRLQSFGNAVEVYPKKDWTTNDVPTVSAMKRYLNDVVALRAVLSVLPTTPDVSPDMDGLTYTEANNIEQILKDIDLMITNMTAAWFYSGDLYAGEV